MNISFDNLVSSMKELYYVANGTSLEMKEQSIEDVLVKNKIIKKQEPRIWSAAELQKMPVGSRFFHSSLGNGVITREKEVKNNFMKFDNCKIRFMFLEEGNPWNMPMTFLGDD